LKTDEKRTLNLNFVSIDGKKIWVIYFHLHKFNQFVPMCLGSEGGRDGEREGGRLRGREVGREGERER
jgi:hypothetical protein